MTFWPQLQSIVKSSRSKIHAPSFASLLAIPNRRVWSSKIPLYDSEEYPVRKPQTQNLWLLEEVPWGNNHPNLGPRCLKRPDVFDENKKCKIPSPSLMSSDFVGQKHYPPFNKITIVKAWSWELGPRASELGNSIWDLEFKTRSLVPKTWNLTFEKENYYRLLRPRWSRKKFCFLRVDTLFLGSDILKSNVDYIKED